MKARILGLLGDADYAGKTGEMAEIAGVKLLILSTEELPDLGRVFAPWLRRG